MDGNGAAAPAWAVAFPPQEESILALAAPDLHSPVYSYAKARPQSVQAPLRQLLALTAYVTPNSKLFNWHQLPYPERMLSLALHYLQVSCSRSGKCVFW